MGKVSKIEWTDSTWNPARGCTKVSPGCESCYALGIAARFSGPGLHSEGLAIFSEKKRPHWTGKVRVVPEHFADPFRWKAPRRIFVNSQSDLFHEGFTNEEIAIIFGIMGANRRHTFQVLTKRAKRMHDWFRWAQDGNSDDERGGPWLRMLSHAACALPGEEFPLAGAPRWPLANVWLGVSVEDQERADERLPELVATPAAVRFVSYEPALGPVDFTRWLGSNAAAASGAWVESRWPSPLDWIIVGGESGRDARRFDVQWARDTIRQCKEAGVACFVKQLGANPWNGAPIQGAPHDPKGGNWDWWSADLRVREFPQTKGTEP